MQRNTLRIVCLLCLLAATGGSGGALLAAEAKSWEDYQILIERNMFSRTRGRRAREATRVVAPEAPNPERFVWLRGVARKNGEYVACLEDMRSGRLLNLRSGDPVVRGELTDVKIDSVRYKVDDEVFEIRIGNNLEATTALPPAGSGAAATGGEAAATGGEAAATSGEGAAPAGTTEGAGDLLERLRQRRERQMGQ
jgi:hypothetical protein